MGNTVRRATLGKKKPARVLMVGLDGSGKSSILYKLALHECVDASPTIGFNVEVIKYRKKPIILWDVGGAPRLRKLWKNYYEGMDCIVFVIDSADRRRLGEAFLQLQEVLRQKETKGCSLLVLANKQDLACPVSPEQLEKALHLHNLNGRRRWNVLPCSAISGDGLAEALEWLVKSSTHPLP